MKSSPLGKARIAPRRALEAGSQATITYTYTAGHPMDDSGYLKIAFRFAGDFGQPQFTDPAAPNYCRVLTNGNCRLVPRWDPKGHTRPWGKALFIQVAGGYLDRGKTITVIFGDRSGGSPGWRVQTFCEKSFEFKTLVDPIATCVFQELPESPRIRIVPGKPATASLIAPSLVSVGGKFSYYLKLQDVWGNPTAKPKRRRHPGFSRPGVNVLKVKDGQTGFTARSNPIEVRTEPAGRGRYWADFHGQSEETIGTNTVAEYFAFARDYARLDIAAHQGNDFQITDAFWARINRTTRKFYAPGAFVTFPGYEWSGNTPLGGDRNVFYREEGGIITRSSTALLGRTEASGPVSPTAAAMFRNLRGPHPFVFAHVGGRYADLSMHDENLEVAVEVHSAWGTFEWLVDEALARGYRIGICANSDGHKGRPGASYPGAGAFGALGGLTCLLAKRLDRRNIYAAIRARHFYATTGNRSILDVTVDVDGKKAADMGDRVALKNKRAVLRVRAIGTAPIEEIAVRNGLDVIHLARPYERADLGRRIKITWSGAEVRGRARKTTWDGELRVKGNRIRRFTPINFWNPARMITRLGANRLGWASVTTGGVAGVVLDLTRMRAGGLELSTKQRRVKCAVKSLGLQPKTWACGGLRKEIRVLRLPDPKRTTSQFSFELPLTGLRKGDNPIYVRVTQEDGHMAWSSPIYLLKA